MARGRAADSVARSKSTAETPSSAPIHPSESKTARETTYALYVARDLTAPSKTIAHVLPAGYKDGS